LVSKVRDGAGCIAQLTMDNVRLHHI
jgi:hypothetical protein